MIRINFREYFYLYESIDQNFDQWLIDLKANAKPNESEIKTFNIPDNKKQFIINTLKSKNVENKQYMKYLIGFATTPQSSHIEDYDRAVDTLKWFIQTNRLTKAQVEADGWFNTGKRTTELTREKDQILNPYSKTKEKKEKKLGIAEDILPLFQSGNIKIYFSPKVTNKIEIISKEDAEKPEIKARHKILCKYGKDTDWCTASPTGTFHAMYSDRNIYIVHIDDKPAYQFMDCSEGDTDNRCQFHDAKNASPKSIPLNLALLIKEKLPKIASFYGCIINTFIQNGPLDLVKYLIDEKEYKINIDSLSMALQGGHLDIIKYLEDEKGAKIDIHTISNIIKSGNLDVVKDLVEKKGAGIGNNAYSDAVESGNLDVVKYVVEKGATIGVNAVNNAIQTGNLDLIEYLVDEKGYFIHNDGFILAIKKGHLHIVKYLVNEKGKEISYDLFQKAVLSGHLNIVKFFMEKNARIARLFNGHMVYLAVGSGNLDLVEYFVDEKGEEIDKEIYRNAIKNAYGAAIENGNLPIIKYFIKKGVKISSQSSDDDPVYFAAQSGKLNIVKYFVEKGAEINNEAISVAFKDGHQNIVDYLKSAINRN